MPNSKLAGYPTLTKEELQKRQKILQSVISAYTIRNTPLHSNTLITLQGYAKGRYSLSEFNVIMDTNLKAILNEVTDGNINSVSPDTINAHHAIRAIINLHQNFPGIRNIETANYCTLIIDELQKRRTIIDSAINTHVIENISLHPSTLIALEEYTKGNYSVNEFDIVMDSIETTILDNLKNVNIDSATLNTINAHHRMKAIIALNEESLPEKFDSSYLKYLHGRLFREQFEPTGHISDHPLTSKDGITASMLTVKILNSNNVFTEDKKIQESLQKFDQMLVAKNNLKGLSRKEFIDEAAKLFSSLSRIHPFKEGNEITQRMFFEKLAEAAGHQLDFSVVTKERMVRAYSDTIEKKDNVRSEVIEHLFEDISNPEKVSILKELIYNEFNIKCKDLNNTNIIMPRDDIPYLGIYKGSIGNAIMVDTENSCVVCLKDYLTPKKLKGLKIGDRLIFKTLNKKNLDTILIPEEQLPPLTEDEIVQELVKNTIVQEKLEKIERYSKTVYKDSKILHEHIIMMNKNPENYRFFSDQIVSDPKSISDAANKKFRSNTDQKDIYKLGNAIDDYIMTVKHRKSLMVEQHNAQQKRLGTIVTMPSKAMQDVLNLPKNMQKETLKSSPLLYKELNNFISDVTFRLLPEEHKALCNADYKTLSESIGISESKAKTIIKLVTQSKELCESLKPVRPEQPTEMNINKTNSIRM
ncbi:BID domain-containing T4SS effector [Bartonella clarridgeiae]|nr:BID domain-containing T4SS effector [Bartonella clarridgeiae]WCR55113.1 MAG: Fic domain protein BH13370 type [Bartonella clarridgeiae]